MKYLVSGPVDEANLNAVVRAFGGEVTLTALPGVQADAPRIVVKDTLEHPMAEKPAKKKRANGNGAEWPAKGSIYDVVLQSIQTGPKTATALREVLTTGGFSAGSVNSALGRLEKALRIKRGEGGWISA